MTRKYKFSVAMFIIMIIGMGFTTTAIAADGVSVNTSVDLYNRYVWRGLDFTRAPSVQPSLSVAIGGLELGAWGAYTLSNEASGADEIDLWLSFTQVDISGITISAIVTDYYFPNAGIELFNYNNHDVVTVINDSIFIPNPGAHLIEIGFSITGAKSFPLTFSGYVNAHNDPGSNTYFQLDYPVTANETNLNFFFGVTGGSKRSPGFYGADKFAVINLGVTAVREIKFSESFSLPLTVSLIVNPKAEISYLRTGISF